MPRRYIILPNVHVESIVGARMLEHTGEWEMELRDAEFNSLDGTVTVMARINGELQPKTLFARGSKNVLGWRDA